MPPPPPPPRVFFITGTSTGLGRALVEHALAEGDLVAATSRRPAELHFARATPDTCLALHCDLRSAASVAAAFAAARAHFGRIDVVVNNAGWGHYGEFEAVSDREARDEWEVNFWGVVNVTRSALHYLRDLNPTAPPPPPPPPSSSSSVAAAPAASPGGRILQISSIAAYMPTPNGAMYCAIKRAVEGFTDSVRAELNEEWGISMVCVEPGGFPTEIMGKHLMLVEKHHPAYEHFDVRATIEQIMAGCPGDPIKGARAIWQIATMHDPPERICIGSDAYRWITTTLERYADEYAAHEELSLSTDWDS